MAESLVPRRSHLRPRHIPFSGRLGSRTDWVLGGPGRYESSEHSDRFDHSTGMSIEAASTARSAAGERILEFMVLRYKRAGLFGLAACMTGVALAVSQYDNRSTWSIVLLSSLFMAAGATVFLFVAMPHKAWLYCVSGAFVITATAARVAILPFWRAENPEGSDALWVFFVTLFLYVPFFFLFWWFWRTQVHPWHVKQRHRSEQ